MDFSYISSVLLFILPFVLGQDDAVGQTVEVKLPGVTFDSKAINEGEGAFFNCEMTPKPDDVAASMKWYLNGAEIGSDKAENLYTEVRRGSLKVKIKSFSESEAGNYTCEGESGGEKDSKSFTLTSFRKMELVSPLEQFGLKGQEGLVECSITGNPPVDIFWTLPNGQSLSKSEGRYIIVKNGIKITEVADEDEGDFICEAEQGNSADTHTIKYDVVVPATIETLSSSSPLAVVGKELKIECLVQGDPAPSIEMKRGEVLVDNENGVLTIKNLTQADEANYTCIATNKGGSVTKTQFFDVKVPPKVSVEHQLKSDDGKPKVEGQSGQELAVKCIAKGDPAPSVAWERNGEKVPDDQFENAEAVKNKEGTEYTVESSLKKELEADDAGMWTCVAEAANVGHDSQEVLIDVQFAATFKSETTEVYSWIDGTAELECKFHGNPLPVISWYGSDDKQITEGVRPAVNNKAEYMSTSVLEITVQNETAFTEYKCRGANSVNAPEVLSEGIITLSEAEKPSAPTLEKDSELTSVIKFKIVAPADDGAKGPTINSYDISYQKSDGERKEKTVSRTGVEAEVIVELTNLTPDTTYTITVNGQSEAGKGAEAMTDIKTLSQSKPIRMVFKNKPAKEEEEKVLDTNYVDLQWEDPDNGGANITKFTITWTKVDENGDIAGAATTKNIEDNSVRTFRVEDLEIGSRYKVTIIATNKIGDSTAELMRVYIPTEETASDPSTGVSKAINSSNNGNSATVHAGIMLLSLLVACPLVIV